MNRFGWSLATLLLVSSASADTAIFNFAQVGNSYSAFLSPSDPLVGQEATNARIYLDVEITAGDAANFFTDVALPIAPFDGNTNALVYLGSELGWTGSGTFHYFLETTGLNGTFISTRFGAETPGEGYSGVILDTSRIEIDTIPEPGSLALLACGLPALLRRR